MTSDIRLAFAHPQARAEASASGDPRDRISLRDHVVAIDIGAFQAERGCPQRVRFDIVLETRPNPAPLEDDVDRILSYDTLTEAISHELAAERLNLLETLAERIAARILLAPRAMRVFVRIEKLDRGPGALGVEIVRTRAAEALRALDASGEEDSVHPRVVYIDNAALEDPGLGRLLSHLHGGGAPVILVVGMPQHPVAETGITAVQRRIDLLAIEQNAWRLAARDRRCLVVSSRTEIDFAMRQGQMIVWAPSKLILDAIDSPDCSPRDAAALALWLAEHVAACEFLIPDGLRVPPGSHVPIRIIRPDMY